MSGGPYGRGKAPERASLKLAHSPDRDRTLWLAAIAPSDPFKDEGGERQHYRVHSNRKVEKGYGRWLTFLEGQGLLDRSTDPAGRITRERVIAYVQEMDRIGNASNTVLSRLQELSDMAKVFAPNDDWSFISQIGSKVRARPEAPNSKRARTVGSDKLLSLGLRLMEEAEQTSTPRLAAIAYRDGLIIALLSLVPLRRGNISGLEMGASLIANGENWTILITAEASKNHDTLEYAWPEMLLPHLQTYLERHRPVLAKQVHRWTADTGDRLWVSSHGSPMTEVAIYDAIAKRTAVAFGTAINPHLFRDEAATALAILDPAHVRSAAPLLGHRQLATTERYYQQAQSLEAQREFAKQVGRMRAR